MALAVLLRLSPKLGGLNFDVSDDPVRFLMVQSADTPSASGRFPDRSELGVGA